MAALLWMGGAEGVESMSKAESGATPEATATEGQVRRPPATRTQEVVEAVHGVAILDSYRWLEDGRSEEVARWVEAQNAYTRSQLDARPGRGEMRERLAALMSIGVVQAPEARGDLYFHTRREGAGQNQPILYVRKGLRGPDKPLLDPNPISPDGTATIDWWYPSWDGKYVAYGISTAGDEKSVLRVREVATAVDRPDVIPHTRYCALGWLPDDSGFYYTRYPAPGSVPAGQENYNSHVFFHRLGTDPKNDPKVFGEGRRPEEIIRINISPDGRWLTAIVNDGWTRSDLLVRDLSRPDSRFVPVAQGLDAIFEGGVVDGVLYIRTNLDAPRYRLVAVDPARPDRASWKVLIPESEAVLDDVQILGGRIVTRTMVNASSRVAVHALDGKPLLDVTLPGIGSVDRLGGDYRGDEAFFSYASFTQPPMIQRIDLKTGATSPWDGVKADLDLSGLEVKQVWYRSKDGTKVSMFVVARKGLVLDGTNPTLLSGYGGFNISETPEFRRPLLLWLERGGVYALPNLRGGGEYGEAWHHAGMLEKKQNVFDDFAAAASWLIEQKYTSPAKLAIQGGSNGGLLVGAALTQHPELYKAVVCAVPLLDMIRYHGFQIAKLWIPEYGSSDSPEQFRWLYAYSPYQHVTRGTAYPAVLLTTAESDSRVDPMHARKMAALLQASTSSDSPILLRTETRAGHGVGKPLSKQIDEAVDTYGFLAWQVGLEKGAAPAPAATPAAAPAAPAAAAPGRAPML
ncbi:MAG TPA: prolyl oligopeptidase family serine peptidase [Patescibacteria group bacterium]|nr:prolyl oligopeptidase family serine peptidase [Patescibacteria group bacterium]